MKSQNPILTGFILVLLFMTGCSSNGVNKCAPCPMALQEPPNINFSVVDKTTRHDLFFGTRAKYATSRLKVHHIVNGHMDTAFLHVDTLNKYFNVRITSVNHVDTVTMNIADLPQDTLLFRRTTTGGCCSTTYLSSVTYDGTVVYTQRDGPDVVEIAK